MVILDEMIEPRAVTSSLNKERVIVLLVLIEDEVVDVEAEVELGHVASLCETLERHRLVIQLTNQDDELCEILHEVCVH